MAGEKVQFPLSQPDALPAPLSPEEIEEQLDSYFAELRAILLLDPEELREVAGITRLAYVAAQRRCITDYDWRILNAANKSLIKRYMITRPSPDAFNGYVLVGNNVHIDPRDPQKYWETKDAEQFIEESPLHSYAKNKCDSVLHEAFRRRATSIRECQQAFLMRTPAYALINSVIHPDVAWQPEERPLTPAERRTEEQWLEGRISTVYGPDVAQWDITEQRDVGKYRLRLQREIDEVTKKGLSSVEDTRDVNARIDDFLLWAYQLGNPDLVSVKEMKFHNGTKDHTRKVFIDKDRDIHTLNEVNLILIIDEILKQLGVEKGMYFDMQYVLLSEWLLEFANGCPDTSPMERTKKVLKSVGSFREPLKHMSDDSLNEWQVRLLGASLPTISMDEHRAASTHAHQVESGRLHLTGLRKINSSYVSRGHELELQGEQPRI